MLAKAIFQLFKPITPKLIVRPTHQRLYFSAPRFSYAVSIRDLPIFAKISQGGSQAEFSEALIQLKDFTSE